MAELRIGQIVAATLMLGTTPIQGVYWGTQQVWANEVVIVLANSTNVILKTLFTTEQWANANLKKRVVVPVGVEIGATQASYAIVPLPGADGQAGSWAGSLTLEVRGTVSGIGGAANSGAGGDVIYGSLPGRNGEKMIVNNYGTIRAGGGGGGKAGNGGAGTYNYTAIEGPLYNLSTHHWTFNRYKSSGDTNYTEIGQIVWAGTMVSSSYSVAAGQGSFVSGAYTYSRGAMAVNLQTGGRYYISRSYQASQSTAGGISGNGGRGQGFDGFSASGAAAAGGGTNAGASGVSGSGGAYGSPGGAGAAGASGNVSAGTAGTAGGLAGFYLNGLANIQFNNFGTVLGRVA